MKLFISETFRLAPTWTDE